MNKAIKLINILFISLILIMIVTNTTYAAGEIIDTLESQIDSSTVGGDEAYSLAGKIINFIQYIAIIGGAILIAVLGLKYMIGSVEEKAEYKKSFVPLIVGIIIVMSATSIARVIFETLDG